VIWGRPPRYEITLILEPFVARRHAEVREAAERVVQAIEQLACEAPEFEDTQLVEVRSITVARTRDIEEERG
jgi:hypothetical protein